MEIVLLHLGRLLATEHCFQSLSELTHFIPQYTCFLTATTEQAQEERLHSKTLHSTPSPYTMENLKDGRGGRFIGHTQNHSKLVRNVAWYITKVSKILKGTCS